jgi:hypothetical protein
LIFHQFYITREYKGKPAKTKIMAGPFFSHEAAQDAAYGYHCWQPDKMGYFVRMAKQTIEFVDSDYVWQ